MLRRWWNWKTCSLVGVIFLGLHALCLVMLKEHYPLWSRFFMWTAPLAACVASYAQTRRSAVRSRTGWALFSMALLLWTAGMSLATVDFFSKPVEQEVAALYDLVYFLYGVPVLLAISLPAQSERVSISLWLDGLQAAITIGLVYVLFFGRLPFASGQVHPIPTLRLMWLFNIENLALAIGATLRLLSHRERGSQRRLYRVMAGFLWIYCLCAGIFNYQAAWLMEPKAIYDLLADLPFVILVVAVSVPMADGAEDDAAPGDGPIALFIENVSPVLYTFALMALGAVAVRTHFRLGMGSIGVALAVYALRTTLLQNRYMRSQRALKEAHDRLEAMALEDALTRVANRRRFDQSLRMEWSRAQRLQSPLTLMFVDIDYFKSLNDRYGHPAGDRCLVEVAAALLSVLPRSGDLLARYGGEEFAVILVNADRSGAEVVAERMQAAIQALKIRNETATGGFLSISIGIKTWDPEKSNSADESLESLVEASDQALYRAKQNGRNRVEFAPMTE